MTVITPVEYILSANGPGRLPQMIDFYTDMALDLNIYMDVIPLEVSVEFPNVSEEDITDTDKEGGKRFSYTVTDDAELITEESISNLFKKIREEISNCLDRTEGEKALAEKVLTEAWRSLYARW